MACDNDDVLVEPGPGVHQRRVSTALVTMPLVTMPLVTIYHLLLGAGAGGIFFWRLALVSIDAPWVGPRLPCP